VQFNSLANLNTFDLIVFSNTSGSNILDSAQRSHFEQYMNAGGNLLGIHAATDTYRHSTANGTATGVWDFYAEAMGGSVQRNPNHVAGTPRYKMNHLTTHPTLVGIPDPWTKNEEYYYWENGYLNPNNMNLLEVETTTGPNGLQNSYDSARVISWFKVDSNNARIFYTAMGHANSNYTNDTLFIKHIQNATNWCLGLSTSLADDPFSENLIRIHPNPSQGLLKLTNLASNAQLSLYSTEGKLLERITIQKGTRELDLRALKKGLYLLVVDLDQKRFTKKLILR
jgi:type 1 glutamine amidotransferase